MNSQIALAAEILPNLNDQPDVYDQVTQLPMPNYLDCHDYIKRSQVVDPVYLFDQSALKNKVLEFKSGFPGEVSYAVKANPRPDILDLLWQSGVTSFDVASPGEIELLSRRLPKCILHYNNPVKTPDMVNQAYQYFGVRSFVVDDMSGVDQLLALPANGLEATLRFKLDHQNAAFDFGSKFGSTPDQAVKMLRKLSNNGIKCSLTFHPGSQCVDHRVYGLYIKMAAEICVKAGVKIERLNVGGGFPVNYPKTDCASLKQYFETIGFSVDQYFGNEAPKLICEPGRAMVAESISLLTEVIHVRESGEVFINDGYYGGLQEQAYLPGPLPVKVYRNGELLDVKTSPRTVFGPTCDPTDKFKYPINLPLDIKSEDRIEFGLMGAYGSATATDFNGFTPATYQYVRNGFYF
jgi:ornithine decarboxylase